MDIKTKLVAALTLAVLVAPGISMAQTMSVAQLQAEIASLTTQLTQLETQLSAAGGSATWCYTFNNNLSIGMTANGDVSALQTALQKDGESINVTGTFDDQTAAAVTAFQEKYASAILTPYGLSNGTGYAGKATRAELNSLFGCGTTTAPTPTPILSTPTPIAPVSPPVSSIQIISPTAGESFISGSTMNIEWAPASVGVAQILLTPVSGGSSYQVYGLKVDGNPTSYSGSYSASLVGIPAGSYYVRVYSALDSIGNGTGATGQSGVITILAQQVATQQTPTITNLSSNWGTATSSITIYGTNLTSGGNPTIQFYSSNGTLVGTIDSVAMDYISPQSIVFTPTVSNSLLSALSPGTYQIDILTPDGTSNSESFTLLAPVVQAPVINSFSVSAGPTFSLSAYNYNTITFQAQCGNFVAVVQPQNGSPAWYPTGSASICNAPQTYSSSSFNEAQGIAPQMINVPLSLYNAQGVVDGSITMVGSPAGSNNSGSAMLTVNVCNSVGMCVQRTASFPIYAKG
jgi:hypothetical protein